MQSSTGQYYRTIRVPSGKARQEDGTRRRAEIRVPPTSESARSRLGGRPIYGSVDGAGAALASGETVLLIHDAGTSRFRHSPSAGGVSGPDTHDLNQTAEWAENVALSFTISVVIPTRNEARNIGWVLDRIGPIVDEIVIVDGLSDDGTVEAATRARPDAIIVRHEVAGKGEAVRAGFAAATGDLIVLLDADGSMDPCEIPRFVEELARGSDMVKGSRFLPGGGTTDISWIRKAGNAGLVWLSNLLLGTSHTELCYGYMAFRRSRLEELDLRSSGFEIETEIVVKACRGGLAVSEVASFESPRRYGTSNLNTFRDGWRVLRTLVRARFAAPTDIRSSSEVVP
jgi:hypothetical protein